jgi:hypothetical protein
MMVMYFRAQRIVFEGDIDSALGSRTQIGVLAYGRAHRSHDARALRLAATLEHLAWIKDGVRGVGFHRTLDAPAKAADMASPCVSRVTSVLLSGRKWLRRSRCRRMRPLLQLKRCLWKRQRWGGRNRWLALTVMVILVLTRVMRCQYQRP